MSVVEKIEKRARALVAPTRPKKKPSPLPVSRSRRIDKKKDAILDAALDLFAAYSFHGASLDRIAERAKISKANLLYHFTSKEELYLAVLRRILTLWLSPLASFEVTHDPIEAISAYIRIKMQYSRDYPQASRLFCLEITQGATVLMGELSGPLRELVTAKTAVIQRWIDDGRIAAIDPYHFIFSLWAMTQHYADFSVQIDAIMGKTLADDAFMEAATANIIALVTNGLRPRPA
ncbi:HTH-type transcriptional regulator RutR [Beijerinckia sp. L45]|uniref:HTH-type transcriptional regulator RutR n=1 Tax=Beijerinckia sp. L45 TaxID=1641855 RepID=UPI00131CAA5E|nr:HTH-type transcriptional regulator RutR [Beijerinckia sp. L45]